VELVSGLVLKVTIEQRSNQTQLTSSTFATLPSAFPWIASVVFGGCSDSQTSLLNTIRTTLQQAEADSGTEVLVARNRQKRLFVNGQEASSQVRKMMGSSILVLAGIRS
jgi:hypothetical protein